MNNTGTKQVSIMKWTEFWRAKKVRLCSMFKIYIYISLGGKGLNTNMVLTFPLWLNKNKIYFLRMLHKEEPTDLLLHYQYQHYSMHAFHLWQYTERHSLKAMRKINMMLPKNILCILGWRGANKKMGLLCGEEGVCILRNV
jgi:D-alanyl-lipoteichoic acid acyltransferase DltB (MBOAT superfamily)